VAARRPAAQRTNRARRPISSPADRRRAATSSTRKSWTRTRNRQGRAVAAPSSPWTSASEQTAYGFAGFDFSGVVEANRATTFGDLFEDVFARHSERGREGGERGADLHIKATLTFEQAWSGVPWPVTVTRQEACRSCAGTGFHRTVESRCVACEGSGVVRSVRGHMVFSKNCPHCSGTGRLRQLTCETCHGQGVETRAETISVRIPPGVADGARVRVPGKGHAGVRGGVSGDLLLDVEVKPHPHFQRVEHDIHMVVPIAIHEAALGARIDVPTPDGPVRLRVPPGTQSGQRFRLRGRGVPAPISGARGDLVIEARILLPRVLDERSKELLREFGRINGESIRDASFGEELKA
jgi:molecular chaperone DnaJ